MSKMILSCTTCSLRGVEGDEILACMKYAPQAGYRYWGIAGPPLWSLGGARWFDAGKAANLAQQAGLAGCTEVYGPQFPTDSLASAEAAAEDIALMFDLAEKMKAPMVVITGGHRNGAAGLDYTIAGIKKLLPMIEKSSARLALEPHMGSQLQTREDFDAVFAVINHPKVGITLDTGHFHSAGVDWIKLIRDYPVKIFNIHLKDHIGRQSVAIGSGEIDLQTLVRELDEIGYEGALAVEMEVVDPENLPQYCVDAYHYIDKLIRNLAG